MGREWEESLSACCSSPLFFVAWCVPLGVCALQGLAAGKLSENGFIVPFLNVLYCGPIGGMINRETIKNKLDINEDWTESCFVWFFCPPCAAIQEYKEVLSR